jgi:hypothetical protein
MRKTSRKSVALGTTLKTGYEGWSMRVFKNKVFSKWATKEGLSAAAILAAVDEMERGLVDAELGGHVVKKRVALAGEARLVELERYLLTRSEIMRSSCIALPRMLARISALASWLH